MRIGYARCSTTEQQAGFDAQVTELKALGCEKLFSEMTSAVGERPQLMSALDFIREGDSLVVTKLDRLARSTRHLGEIVDVLRAKQADLRILNIGIDTSTPTGALVLNLLGAVAEFERAMMLERQRDGIAKAKSEGRYKGRKPTARAQADEIIRRHGEGEGPSMIAKSLHISRASVYRVLS
jgi:DNA invertase Pin-like site-specific DNA recombinase